MDCITKVHDLDKKRTIMIGDRLDTDVCCFLLLSSHEVSVDADLVDEQILFGINGGTASMMVLTGEEYIESHNSETDS